jgi:uncharacterized membrane protein YjdF
MLKDRIFVFSFAVLVTLALIHHFGIILDWYYTAPWLDLTTHFLEGLWAALVILWLVFRSGYVQAIPFSKSNALLVTLISIVSIGMLWELFELWTGILVDEMYLSDTILDALMDTLGALVGLLIILLYQNRAA